VTTTADREREDRHWCSLEDHWEDGDWPEPDEEPEPLPDIPPAAVRLCQVDRPGRWRGERRCLGPVVDGACKACGAKS
jgi:hypothetical protein